MTSDEELRAIVHQHAWDSAAVIEQIAAEQYRAEADRVHAVVLLETLRYKWRYGAGRWCYPFLQPVGDWGRANLWWMGPLMIALWCSWMWL